MSCIGVFGGMGPAATVDFVGKLVKLTPATRDQDHIPLVIASFPHIHDRSKAILGYGRDPLPQLLAGIDFLNEAGVGVIAIPCNSSHHWFAEMSMRSKVRILHIAKTCVDSINTDANPRIAIFATRGALASGFYQNELRNRGLDFFIPDANGAQKSVDDCVQQIKAGNLELGGSYFTQACKVALQQGATGLIMGCTELPIASRHAEFSGLTLIDSSLELAKACINHAMERGWNRPGWDA
jgi:aspartate racemase